MMHLVSNNDVCFFLTKAIMKRTYSLCITNILCSRDELLIFTRSVSHNTGLSLYFILIKSFRQSNFHTNLFRHKKTKLWFIYNQQMVLTCYTEEQRQQCLRKKLKVSPVNYHWYVYYHKLTVHNTLNVWNTKAFLPKEYIS